MEGEALPGLARFRVPLLLVPRAPGLSQAAAPLGACQWLGVDSLVLDEGPDPGAASAETAAGPSASQRFEGEFRTQCFLRASQAPGTPTRHDPAALGIQPRSPIRVWVPEHRLPARYPFPL